MNKRRGHGEGSLYQRADGRWAATIDLGWHNGRRVRKSYYAATRREVVDKLTAARRAMEAGARPTSDRLTVAAYLADWLEAVKNGVRPSTWRGYESMVRHTLVPRLGRIPLGKLSPVDVERMLRDMDTSPRTRSHARTVLRTALARAVALELVPRNVAALAKPPHVERGNVEHWDRAEVHRFLAAIKGHRLEALFTLAVTVGLRQGELLGLRWSDVDLSAGTVSVRQALQRVRGTMQVVEPKTDLSRRTIDLPSIAVEALRAHRKAQDGPIGSVYVFTTPDGAPLYGTAVYRDFLAVTEAAELPRIRFHSLRHTAATSALVAGVPVHVVAKMLGHSTIRLTLDTYAAVLPVQMADAAERIDAYMGNGA